MRRQFWLQAFLLITPIHCIHNITVDDTDPSIIYGDALWSSDSNPTHYNGTLTFSEDHSATVTFTFTGVAVYYLHALFTKSALSADISIDSGVSHRVNLTKPIGAPKDFAQPLWATIDPTNEMHVVDISLPDGGQYIVVDGFIVTALDVNDLPMTPPPLPLSSAAASFPSSMASRPFTSMGFTHIVTLSQTSEPPITVKSIILISGIHGGATLVVITLIIVITKTGHPRHRLKRQRKPELRLHQFWD